MRIGELAKAAGVGVETVRYYQRIGLMPVPPRPAGGTRRYGQAELARLRFIRRAKALGFSLQDIAELLSLGDARCETVEAVTARQLQRVRSRIAALRRMERTLAATLARCRATPDQAPCPIVQTLAEDGEAPSGDGA